MVKKTETPSEMKARSALQQAAIRYGQLFAVAIKAAPKKGWQKPMADLGKAYKELSRAARVYAKECP